MYVMCILKYSSKIFGYKTTGVNLHVTNFMKYFVEKE